MIDQDTFWIILLVWGIPSTYFRSRFRKIVYQTNDWKINIKPLFKKELIALFTTSIPNDLVYIRARNYYRFYLTTYIILFIINFFLNWKSCYENRLKGEKKNISFNLFVHSVHNIIWNCKVNRHWLGYKRSFDLVYDSMDIIFPRLLFSNREILWSRG